MKIVRDTHGYGYWTADRRFHITPRYDLSIRGGSQTRHCGWSVRDTRIGKIGETVYRPRYLSDAKDMVLRHYDPRTGEEIR